MSSSNITPIETQAWDDSVLLDESEEPTAAPPRVRKPQRKNVKIYDSPSYEGPNLITMHIDAKCPVLKVK